MKYHPYFEEMKNLPKILSWNVTKFKPKYMLIDIEFSNSDFISTSGPTADDLTI